MHIPTGDYLIEYLDCNGEAIPGTQALCATLTDAQARAEATAALLGTTRWRIFRCVDNTVTANASAGKLNPAQQERLPNPDNRGLT